MVTLTDIVGITYKKIAARLAERRYLSARSRNEIVFKSMETEQTRDFRERFYWVELESNPIFKKYAEEGTKTSPVPHGVKDEATGKSYGDIHNDTLHGTSRSFDLAPLRYLLDEKNLFNPSGIKPVFLDLGSSIGAVVAYAALHGWQSYGIEIDETRCRYAAQNLSAAEAQGKIPNNSAKVAHGNFFPIGCKVTRVLNEDFIGSDYYMEYHTVREKEDMWGHGLEKLAKDCPENDAYSALGIDIADVDLFYHFKVERYSNLLRLFSQYAKRGAMMIINAQSNSGKHDAFKLPANVFEFAKKNEGFVIYIKV